MTSFTSRAARNFMLIKAAKGFKKDIEQAGLENLKALAENNISIVGTYLNGCSPQKKAELRRDFNTLLSFGITIDMVLDELARQMPELAPLMQGTEPYRKSEIQKVEQFLRGS
jgi:hypothetical protein